MADEDPAQSWALGAHALYRLPELADAHERVANVRSLAAEEVTEAHHDTADLRLARWGVSLVRRSGGGQPGWWLRLPHGEETPVPGARATTGPYVPSAAADLVRGMTRQAPLQLATTATVLSTTRVLTDRHDCELAAVRDSLVGLAVGGVSVDRFRLLTITAPETEHTVAQATLALLAARGAWSDPDPFAVRALGQRAAGEPDIPAPHDVGPDDSAGAALQAFLAQQARKLIRQDVRVRAGLPDSVHQMRVAARRLRSGLRAFEPLVDVDWAEDLRAELGWIAGELGMSRDAEVLLERLDEHADQLGEGDAALIHRSVDPHMHAQAQVGRTSALAALGSARYLALADALVDGITSPPFTKLAKKPAQDVLPKRCRKAWRKLERSVDDLTMESSSHQWHRTRIRAKRARYAVDAVVPVLGEEAEELADALSDVTEVLGEHQDAHIAQLRCRELAVQFDGATGFALGLLQGQERQRELAARKELFREWPRIAHVASHALRG